MIYLFFSQRFQTMPPTPPSNPDTDATPVERAVFKEPTISGPLGLEKPEGLGGPMMAMLSGSPGGPFADGGLGNDGTQPGYLDGHADTPSGPGGSPDNPGFGIDG